MKKIAFLLIAGLFVYIPAISQKSELDHYNQKEYKNKPIWIDMMKDPNVNYYETIKAFREFWKDRILPEEPFEDSSKDKFELEVGLIEENDSEREYKREERLRKRKGNREAHLYAAEVRAFRGWFYAIKPWVRADGSIISLEEQKEILNAQKRELEEVENKNKQK